jgi:hypothetical protein
MNVVKYRLRNRPAVAGAEVGGGEYAGRLGASI